MIPFCQIDMGNYFDGPAHPSCAPSLFAIEGTGHLFVSDSGPGEFTFLWSC